MSLSHSEVAYLLSEKRVAAVQNAWQRYDLELGLPGIDKQHMWLLAILLDLETLLQEQEAPGESPASRPGRLSLEEFDRAFRRLLEELIDYTIEHFDLEENFLRQIHYPGFSAHKRQHMRFVAGLRMRLRNLPGRDEAELLAAGQKLLQSLKQWLLHHILSEDRAYADELSKRSGDAHAGARECESILRELGIHIRFEQERLYQIVQHSGSPAAVAPQAETLHTSETNIIRRVAGLWHAYRLQLGIPIIDMQHLWLIKLIAELEAAQRDQVQADGDGESDGNTEAKDFQAAIVEVQNYVAEHFSTEEALMREFNFPGLPGHIRQHESFVESVEDRIAEAKSGVPLALHNLVRDLKQWLVGHIAGEDRRIYYFLRRRPAEVNEFVRKLAARKQLKLRQGYLELYNEIIHFKISR
ncbi:MAG: hemerythrin domain-containing protein [bacterium]|nr:hemerythrin domain-containing protein [bacterium]